MKKTIILLLLAFGFQSFAQKITFSERKDVKALELKHEKAENTNSSYKKSISFSVDAKQIFRYRIEKFDALKMEGLYESGNPGEPTTYLMSKKVSLPSNAIIKGVKLLSGDYVEVQENLSIIPVKELQMWDGQKKPMEWKKDEAIYSKNENFPGKSIDYMEGSNGKETIVSIKFFPIQFNPVNKKVFIITNAQIEVQYDLKTAHNQLTNPVETTTAENIILTTYDLIEAANSLKTLHENAESLTTEVITTGWIDSNYTAAEDPTIDGYANITNNPVNAAYDYELAKKIVSYLRDDASHPNLESITIIGDALVVPPSYYFYENWANDSYTDWIVSDLFYSSPDYDFMLNFQVGRLPVTTVEEANQIVAKLTNWKNNLSEDWFHNTNIVGGVPFATNYLIGEVITLDAVNHSYFQGKNITKNFASNGTESRTAVLPLFSDENTGMIFHIGHGSGTAIALEPGSVGYTDMMALPAKEKYPVLVSIACMNGGYDADLMDNAPFENAFSEGVLRSQAGGIAYWGGVRNNAGVPNVSFMDNGQWIIGDQPLMAKMLTNLFKAYAEGHITFGSINNTAFTEYMDVMNPNSSSQWATAFEFVFLGDPALSLLPQQPNTVSTPMMEVSPNPDVPGGVNPPKYNYSQLNSLELEFTSTTSSEFINQKLFTVTDVGGTNLLSSNTLTENDFLYAYEPTATNNFMLAYEASNFKETRLYFDGEMAPNIAPFPSTMFEAQNQNGGNFDLSWSTAEDMDGTVESYNLFEGKNPSVFTDEFASISNWESYRFMYTVNNESGHSQGGCIVTFPLHNMEAFIESKYPISINEGTNLEFNLKYDTENNFDFFYVKVAEPGEEYETIETYTGSNSAWEPQTIDLSDYVGKQLMFKFVYKTNYQNLGQGVYLDDINLTKAYGSTQFIENIADTTYTINGNSTAVYEYGVEAVDNYGDKSAISNLIAVDVINIGIEDKTEANKFAMFPNPAKDRITINCPVGAKITFYNMVGQAVLEKNIASGQTTINTESLPRGCYFLKVEGNDFRKVQKLILE